MLLVPSRPYSANWWWGLHLCTLKTGQDHRKMESLQNLQVLKALSLDSEDGKCSCESCTGLQLPIPGTVTKKPWCILMYWLCIYYVTYVWQPPHLGNPLPLEGRQLKSLQDLPQGRIFQTLLHVQWRSSQGEGKYLGSHIQKEMWLGRLGGR